MKLKRIVFSCIILSMLGLLPGCRPQEQKAPVVIQFPTISYETETAVFESTLWTPTFTETNTLIPTNTLTASATLTPIPPTATFTPIPPTATLKYTYTPSFTPSITPTAHRTKTPSITPTFAPPTLTPKNFDCTVISTDPSRYFAVHPREDFDGHFKLYNSGGLAWFPNKDRYRFIDGTPLHKTEPAYAISTDIPPLHYLEVTIDMTAPDKPGKYYSVWSFEHGQEQLCQFTFSITVLEQ